MMTPCFCLCLYILPSLLKNTFIKGWGSSPVGECLPSIYKAPGLIPSNVKKKLKNTLIWYRTMWNYFLLPLLKNFSTSRISFHCILTYFVSIEKSVGILSVAVLMLFWWYVFLCLFYHFHFIFRYQHISGLGIMMLLKSVVWYPSILKNFHYLSNIICLISPLLSF